MNWWQRLRARWGAAPGPAWDEQQITDEWFRAHFGYAADVVQQWLSPVVDLATARVMNFGCGDGITDLGLALRHGAQHIHGIDIRREYAKLPRLAQQQLGLQHMPRGLTFQTIEPSQPLAQQCGGMDTIVSWSTFEHVQRDQLLPILRDLHDCLRPGGYFFLQIEPLYYSAFGSHLGRYNPQPWHHLLETDEKLWEIIQACEAPLHPDEVDSGFADFGPEGYKRFVFKEYQELNRLTASELMELTRQAGFQIVREECRHYEPQPVPESLLQRYSREVLTNNEVFLLMQKI